MVQVLPFLAIIMPIAMCYDEEDPLEEKAICVPFELTKPKHMPFAEKLEVVC